MRPKTMGFELFLKKRKIKFFYSKIPPWVFGPSSSPSNLPGCSEQPGRLLSIVNLRSSNLQPSYCSSILKIQKQFNSNARIPLPPTPLVPGCLVPGHPRPIVNRPRSILNVQTFHLQPNIFVSRKNNRPRSIVSRQESRPLSVISLFSASAVQSPAP
jgi:hypothetical protein